MWLFTTDGFYSVVTAEEFGEDIQIRARAEADLNRLRERWLPELGPSMGIPNRDYPWRAFTTREAFGQCLAQITLNLDYDNFKDAVAQRLSEDRSHIYLGVWSACRAIEDEPASAQTATVVSSAPIDYESQDLVVLGLWPDAPMRSRRYGAVMFDSAGRVLLREPLNHYDGYVWTFSKGKPDIGERPVDTARRETLEETGYLGEIVGHVPGVFKGGVTGSANYFYLMRVREDAVVDSSVRETNGETASVRWVEPDEARALISQSTNFGGRERDLEILDAAVRVHAALG